MKHRLIEIANQKYGSNPVHLQIALDKIETDFIDTFTDFELGGEIDSEDDVNPLDPMFNKVVEDND